MYLHREPGPAPHRAFLPKTVADMIPPSSENLPKLQQIFSIKQGTKMSSAMTMAILICSHRGFCSARGNASLPNILGVNGGLHLVQGGN